MFWSLEGGGCVKVLKGRGGRWEGEEAGRWDVRGCQFWVTNW